MWPLYRLVMLRVFSDSLQTGASFYCSITIHIVVTSVNATEYLNRSTAT